MLGIPGRQSLSVLLKALPLARLASVTPISQVEALLIAFANSFGPNQFQKKHWDDLDLDCLSQKAISGIPSVSLTLMVFLKYFLF